ncbi:hypothetical protein EWM64_g10279 [Hericium alpestre]|uniref:AB hydrolase-1 domain-containing protein n=1 Tax=Hericium alpestre TaxID=135208 RepID=A0A4Y9ZIN9_9AGAM|nr:hypothetical protein EWM64_g10279 [Hericium alpestre]
MSTPLVAEGVVPFVYNGEQFSTWYKLVGDCHPERPPLIILHGGPGTSHDYMLPLADLASHSPPTTVLLYDQIGTARSTHLPDKPGSFWTIDLFVAELENILTHFGFTVSFDLLGHSWGAQLAVEFILRRQPAGLRRLVIADGLASTKMRTEARDQLMRTMPQEVQDTIRKHDEEGTRNAPEYKMAWRAFYARHACRLDPPPKEVIFSLGQSEDDSGGGNVLNHMRKNILDGDYSLVDQLHLIRVPTLLINGEYDFMTDKVVRPFFDKIEKVKWVKFAQSSHMPHWEERERYIDIVGRFLAL